MLIKVQSVEVYPPTKVQIQSHLINSGSKSRAGDPQVYYDDPNRQMLRETGAGVGIETMSKNLSIDREYERIRT